MLDWLSDIDLADKLVVDLVLYLFSIGAFALMPAHFGRKVWILVAWFLFLNLAFLMDFWDFLNWEGPALFILLGQVPWILFVLDLLFKGRLSSKVAAVPMREILLWQVTRIMGIHFVIAIYGGYAPEEFALQVGFSEAVTGLGALALYVTYRPEKGWYRTLLIFWNTYGLTSVLSAEVKIFLSNPHLPFSHFSREIFQYMTSYPQNWVYCFWFPIAIGMHAAVFYKMYQTRGAKAA
ncbi:MAG: hypothetical protein JWO30_2393 [Fibrobacteres bacterium]|nr:hypothetical protein [Fibrobacterota bacterium]